MTAPDGLAVVRELLDQLDTAHAAATPGPWDMYELRTESDHMGEPWSVVGIRSMTGWIPQVAQTHPLTMEDNQRPSADAAVIVADHNAVPQLVAVVRAVLDRHHPVDRGPGPQCAGCATHITFTPWPCATFTDVVGALTAGSADR